MTPIHPTAEFEIKKFLGEWWLAVNRQLAAATGSLPEMGDAPLELLYASEIGQRLAHLAAAAEGQLPWSGETAREITEDCRAFETWLNQTPLTHKTPEEFWATPLGFMVLRARVWAAQDRLISLSEAAEESGMSLSVLSQRISRGQITGYRNPLEKNPQRARRILLSDLNLLLHEGIVHKRYNTPLNASQHQPQTLEVVSTPP